MKTKLLLLIITIITISKTYCQKTITINVGHSNGAKCLEFTPDGKFLASGSYDETIKLWDVQTGKEIRTFLGHKKNVMGIAISPDGKYIVSGSNDSTLKLWDITNGNEIKTFKGHTAEVNDVCFNSDGKQIISCGDDKTLKIWDIKTGKAVATLVGHRDFVNSVCCSPNGKYVVSCSKDSTLILWDLYKKEKIKTLTGHKDGVNWVDFSPDGKRIASCSGDGIYASESSVKIWDVESGKQLKDFWKHYKAVASVAYGPDDTYICSASNDKKIRIWDIATSKVISEITIPYTWVNSVVISPDNNFVAIGSNLSEIIFWNHKTGEIINNLKGFTQRINKIRYSNDGNYFVTAKNDSTLKLWDTQSGALFHTLKGHSSWVTSVEFSSDNKQIVSVGRAKDIKIWDLKTAKDILTINTNKHRVENADFNSDNSLIASVGGCYNCENFALWDGKTGEKIKTPISTIEANKIVDFSSDNKYVMTTSYNSIVIWDYKNGKEVQKFNANLACLSDDGKYIALFHAKEKKFEICETASGAVIKQFSGHTAKIKEMAFSPDGKYIATGGGFHDNYVDYKIRIWSIEEGKTVKILDGHEDYIESLDYSKDGKHLISAGNKGIVRYWDVETGKLIASFIGIQYSDEWIVFTPDGYWDGSMNCSEYFAMVEGLEIWNIDQFAAKYNRPDIILQRLGSPNKELIEHYYKQFKKRLRKLNITEKELEAGNHTPESKIISSSLNAKSVNLKIEFRDSKYLLKSYNIFINDVPLFAEGKSLNVKNKTIAETVELTRGMNKIEVSCINEKGTESIRDAIYHNYDTEEIFDLYYIGIGVSNYMDQNLNLKYAHKDAIDLGETFLALKDKGYKNVYIKTLINEQVTTENIKAAKEFLKNAKPDDTFVLFIAGHGLHDKDEESTYYFLTYNTDLENLQGTAANFEFIENLLQGIAPRKKLFLMDACESGEIDEEDNYSNIIADASNRGLQSRGFKQIESKQQNIRRKITNDKSRFIYSDLLRRTGAIVFSSSRGHEYSYEFDKLKNGLFTEFILEALKSFNADLNKDGYLSTDELRDYVIKQVSGFSGGAQNPTVDRDNIFQKFSFKINERKQLAAGHEKTIYSDLPKTQTKGVFTDPRDGTEYGTVTYNYVFTDKNIMNVTWMTENLNFKKLGVCSNHKDKNCENYGSIYTWGAARKACPEGWHLPDIKEWEMLKTHFGGKDHAYKNLKSTKGWKNNNGTNISEFNAFPFELMEEDSYDKTKGSYSFFWINKEESSSEAYYIRLGSYSINNYYRDKKNRLYVRCVKD